MSQLQADLVISLFAAHVIADFVLQTQRGVEAKRRAWVFVGHCVVVAVLSYVLTGLWSVWAIPLVVFVTHLAMDFVKSRYFAEGLRGFLIDQVVHLAVIAVLVYLVPRIAGTSQAFWQDAAPDQFYPWLLGAAGFLATTWAGSVLVGLTIGPYAEPADADPLARVGVRRGGRMIGLLERALIFLFVVVGQPTAIGFLIAAKSILRFGEVGRGADRREVEYIIIGTLMSFLVALVVSYLTREAFLEYRSAWLTP